MEGCGHVLGVAKWPRVKAMLATAKRLGTLQGSRQPEMLVHRQIHQMAEHERDDGTRALLALCWVSAQRPCDVLQLRFDDVTLDANGKLRLRFRAGKQVGSQGMHHIHTAATDTVLRDAIRKFVEQRRADGNGNAFIFPAGTAYLRAQRVRKLREAIRRVAPGAECRSLRRSTLCAMAKAGATETQLRQWSRHTTEGMLRRYLYFEEIPAAEHRTMQDLATRGALDGQRAPSRGDDDADGAAPAQSMQDIATDALAGAGDVDVSGGNALGDEYTVCDGFIAVGADGRARITSGRAAKPKVYYSPGAAQAAKLRLHASEASAVKLDLRKLTDMALYQCNDPEVRLAWLHDRLELTNDGGRYSIVPWDGEIQEANLEPGDVPVLVACALAAIVHPSEVHKVRGTVGIFTRPELEKARRRRLTWTKAYNDTHHKRDVAPNRGNATRETSRGMIVHSRGAITLDFNAWFDFFPLDEDVTWFECFKVGNVILRNLTMAMGKVSSTSVATSATRVIGAFDMGRGVTFKYATDGVIFAGPKQACADAAWWFIQRAWRVGAVVKGLTASETTHSDVSALWETKDVDWVGDIIDFERKTVRCRDRHVERMKEFKAECLKPEATYADRVRAWSMFQYMSSALAIPRHKYQSVRRYFSGIAQTLAKDPSLWDTTCTDRPLHVEFPLDDALAECIANRPARVVPAPKARTVSIVDACGYGWAAIVCHRHADGSIETTLLQAAWTEDEQRELRTEHSTRSEPECLARAAAHVTDTYGKADGETHIMLSDHEGFVHAYAFGGSPDPFYNDRVKALAAAGVDAVIFTPGETNIADKYSRLQVYHLTAVDRAAAVDIAQKYFGRSVGKAYRMVGQN